VPRIGFDGRALASPAAGVRRYAAELFGALAALNGDLTIVAVGAPEETALPARVERAPGAASLPTNAGWMLTGLPRAARRARLDLFHAPAYTVPLGSPRPLAVTIHDVSYERHPEWYPYRRDPIRRAFYRRSARAADRVITDSAFSKAEIAAAYGLRPDVIDVVPLAAAPIFSAGPAMPLPSYLPARYVLHVGDVHVRRNLGVVVRAMMIVRQRNRGFGDVGLVLAGVPRDQAGALHSTDTTTNGAPMLTRIGQADETFLLALYRSAAALVYPSRYEGFGLPLLEAMACGVPVIASRTSCIPEVTGGAAVLLDPDDDDGWSAALERVLGDEAYAAGLRQAGQCRASSFSWRRTAEETAAIYARLLGRL
jgi:glycosyltransferase involved in cell wall biosynthesis